MDYNSFVYDIFQICVKLVSKNIVSENIVSENIVIIGTQQHSSSFWRNILPWKDVGPNSKFMFVHQAIRTVRLGKMHKWCILLCDEGYTEGQQDIIKQTFYSIQSNNKERVVIDFQTTSSPQGMET